MNTTELSARDKQIIKNRIMLKATLLALSIIVVLIYSTLVILKFW